MNTPAHIIINLFCVGREDKKKVITPVVIGAVLPDAAMFLMYFVEKVIKRTPDSIIWGEVYYQDRWQDFFDIFNSLPLSLAGLAFSFWTKSKVGILLFASMILHIFGDLPLHNDDGHRHFFPFSNWRFVSPVSYWDPDHHGTLVTILEILVVLVLSILLFRLYKSRAGKITLGLVGLSYLLYLGSFIPYFFFAG